MSLVMDASAAVALHFADECLPFAAMEEALEKGEAASLMTVIESSIILLQWNALWTNTSGTLLTFSDLAIRPMRFYRAVER